MTPENEPEQQQIDHWLKVAEESLDRRFEHYHSGFYEKEDLSMQTFYLSLGDAYTELAIAQFLNGELPEVFRANFSKGAAYVLKNFHMVYDPNDPDYVGDQPPTNSSGFGYGCADWYFVNERHFIEGMHRAFMAGDFDAAEALANVFQDPKEPYSMDEIEVRRYAQALKFIFLDQNESAIEQLTPTFDKIKSKIDQGKGKKTSNLFALNYQLLTYALYGIVTRDETLFNDGLMLYIAFNQHDAQGESKDTPGEFVCDEAVALANLGIHFKLNVKAEHYTLPKGLLIQPVD